MDSTLQAIAWRVESMHHQESLCMHPKADSGLRMCALTAQIKTIFSPYPQ